MSDNMQRAVADVAEVMKFENWLRFYFATDQEDEAVRIEVPDEQLAYLEKNHAHLHALALKYHGQLIDYQTSCTQTCAYIAFLYDGTKYPTGMVGNVWDSKELKIEMYVFGLWMQGAEDQLDEEFMEFSEWMAGFESWKGTDEVQDYLNRLTDVDQGGPVCGTVQ